MFRQTLSAVLITGLAAVSMAGPQSIATNMQRIRAGIVVLDSDIGVGSSGNGAPYAFYNLDKSKKVKPGGWNIYNPYGASRLSGYSLSRWQTLDPLANPQFNTQVTKATAPYWEVFLSQVNDSQMADYDVLMVTPTSRASLNPTERERLKRFVDQGGILWVDLGKLPTSSGIDQINGFPLAFRADLAAGTSGLQSDFSQPLLSKPYLLSGRESELINGASRGSSPFSLSAVSLSAGLSGIFSSLVDDFGQLEPVTIVGGRSTISIARIGDGFMVVTGRGATVKLNSTRSSSTNNRFQAEQVVLDADGLSAAKFAVNLLSLSGEFRQQAGGSRKTNSSAISVTAPLLRRFTGDLATTNTSSASPVFYKGMMFASVGDHVVAYDANPTTDLDRDGDPDDGTRDFGNGSGQDVLWTSATMPGPISAPICVEVPNSTVGPVDQVIVVDAAGSIHAFSAFNTSPATGFIDQSGSPQAALYVRAAPNGASSSTPPAPTAHEGLLFVADQVSRGLGDQGRIWILDLATGKYLVSPTNSPYVLGGTGTHVNLPSLSTSPTIGYIPNNDGSGGTDKVAYLGFDGAEPAQPNQGAGIISLWIGARGEKPADVTATGGTLQVTTRASQQGGLGIKTGVRSGLLLHVIDQNGNPWSEAAMASYFQGTPYSTDGVITFTFAPGKTELPAGATVRVDYDIDWSDTNSDGLQSVVRGQLNLPDTSLSERKIVGNIAISPQGTIYVVMSSRKSGSGGDFYAFRESSKGVFQCLTRYSLYDRHDVLLNQVGSVSYDEVLFDKDPVNHFLPNYQAWGNDDRRLRNFTFVGGPSVRNGQVFVTAVAAKKLKIGTFSLNFNSMILMAFKAEPSAAQFKVGDLPDGTVIVQPDLSRSQDRTSPEQQSILQSGAYTYDPEKGVIRFDSLMNVERGPIQNCLSLSQPVIIRKPNSPDVLLEPDSVAGTWNPLLWHAVLIGLDRDGDAGDLYNASPVVLGNTVYVAGKSVVPDILSGNYNPLVNPMPQATGLINAFDADISPNDTGLHAEEDDTAGGNTAPYRAWQKQLWTLSFKNGAPQASEHQLWPQNRGLANFEEYVVRLNQSTLPTSIGRAAWGLAGGDSTLVAWGPSGLVTYNRADVVVCDEGRVGIFDASGNAVYSSTAFASSGANGEGAAGVTNQLVRPTRAYEQADGSLLIVDTGANRIFQAGLTGVESRSIRSFFVDPNHVPGGFATNESTSLKGPRDVLSYGSYVTRGANDLVSGQQNLEYWVHYLIADGGNHRLIELIDRYRVDSASRRILEPITVTMDDPTTPQVDIKSVPQLGVLLWHSPASVSGSQFEYNSVARVYVPPTASTAGRFVYLASVGGALPTRASVGLDTPAGSPTVSSVSGNGGVVIFDPLNPNGSQVISKLSLPDVSGAKFWDESAGQYGVATDPLVLARRKGGEHYLTGVSSVSATLQSGGAISIMLTDNSGVYEATLGDPTTDTASVNWMLSNEMYRSLRRGNNTNASNRPSQTNPQQLRPTFARRLESGDILVVNGYVGRRLDGSVFNGEVLQLDGGTFSATAANGGFSIGTIRFDLNTISGARGLIAPVFANRR
jgi:hypothetical protein